jgi:hypothetical protein
LNERVRPVLNTFGNSFFNVDFAFGKPFVHFC